jgi:hypothetical protein
MKKSTFFEELPARKNPVHQPGSPNSAAEGPTGANPKGGTGEEASAKRIRQAVYDIRYRARREEIELEAAYNQYIGNTSMTAPEKASVREKLFGESFDMLGEGKKQTEKQYVVRVRDRAAGTQYWRKATRKKISQLRSNPNIGGQGVEMSTYKKPYEEGDKKNKSGKGKVNTKKDVTEAKKGDGNLANNYPPYDKVTRGDIIAGALGKDQEGGKKKKRGMKEEWDSILSDPMLRLVSDAELEATVFDVFEEIEQEGFLTEALEFIDSDQFLTEERDAGAMAKGRLERKRMGATADGPAGSGGAAKRFVAKKAKQAVKSGAERVGAAVKKVGSAIKSAGSVAAAKAKAAGSAVKSGVKSAAKSGIGAASKAAGHAVGSYQGARDKARAAASKSEPPKAASTDTSKSGTTAGSAAAKSSSSSSSDSDSSSSGGGEKKKGFLRRLGGAMKRNLKKAAGKTLRGISSATDKGAKKLGEEVAPKVKVKSESFDWRSEFFEGLQDNLAPEDEDKINLKKGIKNKVVINPQMEEKQAEIEKKINEAKARVEINQMESTIEVDPLKHAVEKAVQERLAKTVNEENTQVSEVVSSLSDRISKLRTESAEDRLRDKRQERGGVGANVDYNRPPAKKATNSELGIAPMTDAQRAKRAKEMAAHLKKMKG